MKIGAYEYKDNPIGYGSYSTVYKGVNTITKQIVAIKRINKQPHNDEINILKRIEHPNIIKLIDVINDDKYTYIILEYCSESDLSVFLDNKPLREKYAQKYMRQISSALKYLHNCGILHRDLKPQNILMTNIDTIKLTDFGFAKKNDNNNIYKTICGSPIYMAPEIIKHSTYDNKTDLWSVGVILYEMLFGYPPFKASTQYELINRIETEPIYIPNNINVSNECKDLLMKLLQKEPDNRINWTDFFFHPWIYSNTSNESDTFDLEKEVNDDYDITFDQNDFDISGNVCNYGDVVIQSSGKTEPITVSLRHKKYCNSPLFNSPETPDGFLKIVNTPNEHSNCMQKTLTKSFVAYMKDGYNYLNSLYCD